MRVLIVDGANVVGSRPDGWWRDRAGAAARLHDRLAAADVTDLCADRVVLVLEGKAKAGHPVGLTGPVRTLHAPRSGDDTIVEEVAAQVRAGVREVVVVTADKELRRRCEAAGAHCMTPGWLLERLR